MSADWREEVTRLRFPISVVAVLIGGALAGWYGLATSPQAYVDHHPDVVDHELPGVATSQPRSSRWPKVRAAYLKGHPVCEACGSRSDINVHHVRAFNEAPELELDPLNLITLDRACHLKFGHVCENGHTNWSCANPDVRKDAAMNLMKLYGPKNLAP